jgi:hypothetical protein
MTGSIDRVEVITSVQRRRRWSAVRSRASSRRPTRRRCQCRWSRDSTGSRRTKCSNGGSAMPRARCQRSGRRRGGGSLRIPGFAAPVARIATVVGHTLCQAGLLQASIELVLVQYFYASQHCDARRNHRCNNSCRFYLGLDGIDRCRRRLTTASYTAVTVLYFTVTAVGFRLGLRFIRLLWTAGSTSSTIGGAGDNRKALVA